MLISYGQNTAYITLWLSTISSYIIIILLYWISLQSFMIPCFLCISTLFIFHWWILFYRFELLLVYRRTTSNTIKLSKRLHHLCVCSIEYLSLYLFAHVIRFFLFFSDYERRIFQIQKNNNNKYQSIKYHL